MEEVSADESASDPRLPFAGKDMPPHSGYPAGMQRRVNASNKFYNVGTPVAINFAAGAAAGSVHSVLSLAFDSLEFRSLPALHTAWTTTLHHSIAHSFLFGYYELTKRYLSSYAERFVSIADNSNDEVDDEEEVNVYEVATSAIAGGVAGVMQYTVSHYTGMWLRVDTNDVTYYQLDRRPWSALENSQERINAVKRMFQPLPPLRPMLITFPIMAVAFVAFEYGKEL